MPIAPAFKGKSYQNPDKGHNKVNLLVSFLENHKINLPIPIKRGLVVVLVLCLSVVGWGVVALILMYMVSGESLLVLI